MAGFEDDGIRITILYNFILIIFIFIFRVKIDAYAYHLAFNLAGVFFLFFSKL